MRIAYWDIETSDLNAEFGRLLCASVLSLPSEKLVSIRQDTLVKRKLATSMADDRALAVTLRDMLETHHVTSGWFSKGFDISFLNTRLVAHGERLLHSHLHLDGIWYTKGWRGIRAKSASLKSVAAFFGLEEAKMEVDAQTWIAARAGEKKAMDIAVQRCESDVRLTRQVTERLLDAGLVKNIQQYP